MGNVCACNNIAVEKIGEFCGFKSNKNSNQDYKIITKKNFKNYDEKDKKYYTRTDDYENTIKNTIIDEIEENNKEKEYENGTVTIIKF